MATETKILEASEVIKRLKKTGMTQEEIAKALGCTQVAVSQWKLKKTFPIPIFRGELARVYREVTGEVVKVLEQ